MSRPKSLNELIAAKRKKLSQMVTQMRLHLAKLGRAKHTTMLCIVTIPENEDDKKAIPMIAYAGDTQVLAEAINERCKHDPNFHKFMAGILYKSKVNPPKEIKESEK